MIYFRYLITTALTILTFAAAVNIFADPAGIYRSNRNSPTQLADALIQSEHGLWWPEGWLEERALKKALAKHSSDVDCIVIGSSRVMQVGSARKASSLVNACSSILNLGVGGAGIEDHFALVYLSITDGHPKKMILGIDPWTFAFGKDRQWSYYSESYQLAKQAIQGGSPFNKRENDDVMLRKLRNLFSLEYTIRSVRKAMRDIMEGPSRYSAEVAPRLDETIGGRYPVFLRDGSLQYSAKFLVEAKVRPIPHGGVTYNTDGILNDAGAINAYRSLIKWIKSKGIEPILLLTPYHQNVWKAADSLNTRAIQATEPIVRALALELRVSVIGTYNPDTAGCLGEEFFDFMHPKADCLAKLENLPG